MHMEVARSNLSLSGTNSRLISIGGESGGESIKIVEEFLIPYNKWTRLPSLMTPRAHPASCLLHSLRAFTFCGFDGEMYLNTIEKIDLPNE